MQGSFWLRGVGVMVASLLLCSCPGGAPLPDAGSETDAGAVDSGAPDDEDAGVDAGVMDGGVDGGHDAGTMWGPTLAVTPDPTLAFGTLGFIPGAPVLVSTRAFVITNTGPRASPPNVGSNLHLDVQPMEVSVISGAVDELCVGDFDRTTRTCSNAFPSAYNANVGIEGGRSLQLLVHVVPQSTGHKEFELVLFTNDGVTPEKHLTITADVVLTESCAFTVTPARVDFGVVTDGGLQTKTFMLHNAGTDVCYFDSFEVSPTGAVGFSLPAPYASVPVAPGADATVVTNFVASAPPVLTLWSSVVRFSVAMTTASSSEVPLEATQAEPCLSITPDALGFGDVAVGCSAVLRVTVNNTCLSPLSWNGAALTNAANTCPDDGGCPQFSLESVPDAGVMQPNQQRAFTVRFTPGAQATAAGNVDVLLQADGPATAVHVSLAGTGVAPDGGCGP